MEHFKTLISRQEQTRNDLHAKLKAAFKLRDRSDLAWNDWKNAANRFRASYGSEVDQLISNCVSKGLTDAELREFAFAYASVDPYYFRSGYAMEKLVRKMKRLSFDKYETETLQSLILKRIDTKALRNFRDICRLIPMIQDKKFSDQLKLRMESSDSSIAHRAKLAVEYLKAD